ERAGRLARPKHWLDFAPFVMAHAPLKMSIEEARMETRRAWEASYSPERNRQAVESIKDHHIKYRISVFVARLFFRGIYFPQMTRRAWLRLLYENRRTISSLAREGFSKWRASRRRASEVSAAVTTPAASSGD
ncbi:MAG TPA: hypothetical protein VN282_13925, partial [Pyrinomonadaceae bacterium]|nr:hypothetical protein [Pyrinomonadaceae bacterium]